MAPMSDENEKPKRFRSPPYPMFDLGKAVERAKEVYSKANAHAAGVQVLAEAWGMKSVDGKVWRTAASLIQYGLMQDSGTGKNRKFQITDAAKRIILDTSPDSQRRQEAIQNAALGPMIHRELWDRYNVASGLSDTVIRTHLTIDREEGGEAPYSPAAADEVIATYRATIAYAGLEDSTKVSPQQEDKADENEPGVTPAPRVPNVKVGDFVQWESGGVIQFEARKVDWVSEDGSHLRVFGSPAGIPMSEVELVDAPHATQKRDIAKPSAKGGKLNVTAYVDGGRLQLTADVGPDEIADLKDMLAKYEEILKLLS
ncbi:hypothetical protein BV98_002037 [Sphingobium herbicidovorans NBRC 16415]|uniref:Uncharacterized protein n=4 Tax=Sphingobium herbicidovorans TaxID=76947 RepID=A0A086PA13_SPHHM|nr:hypothetical protein BV98_002032 [Sphingobium herbicidovorans NBRC 16415]KFG90231.1 hypothetical protein BV98_002037 [Sphingobium herbicidovorans NBRC 16415]